MTTNFNELPNDETERLALLMEEAAEVQQVIGKIFRHGYASTHPDGGPNNRSLLEKELGHLVYAIDLMIDKKDIGHEEICTSAERKWMSVKKYLHHTPNLNAHGVFTKRSA